MVATLLSILLLQDVFPDLDSTCLFARFSSHDFARSFFKGFGRLWYLHPVRLAEFNKCHPCEPPEKKRKKSKKDGKAPASARAAPIPELVMQQVEDFHTLELPLNSMELLDCSRQYQGVRPPPGGSVSHAPECISFSGGTSQEELDE